MQLTIMLNFYLIIIANYTNRVNKYQKRAGIFYNQSCPSLFISIEPFSFSFGYIYFFHHILSRDRQESVPQHFLDKNAISPRRILHQHVRHCPYQLAVLDNRATAHTLYDPTGQGQ